MAWDASTAMYAVFYNALRNSSSIVNSLILPLFSLHAARQTHANCGSSVIRNMKKLGCNHNLIEISYFILMSNFCKMEVFNLFYSVHQFLALNTLRYTNTAQQRKHVDIASNWSICIFIFLYLKDVISLLFVGLSMLCYP